MIQVSDDVYSLKKATGRIYRLEYDYNEFIPTSSECWNSFGDAVYITDNNDVWHKLTIVCLLSICFQYAGKYFIRVCSKGWNTESPELSISVPIQHQPAS